MRRNYLSLLLLLLASLRLFHSKISKIVISLASEEAVEAQTSVGIISKVRLNTKEMAKVSYRQGIWMCLCLILEVYLMKKKHFVYSTLVFVAPRKMRANEIIYLYP